MLALKQSWSAFRTWSITHSDVAFALGVTIVLRLWFAFWGIAAIVAHGTPIVPNSPTLYYGAERIPDEGLKIFLSPWQRWDVIWYLKIAESGYSTGDLSPAYFPLLPALTRILATVTQDYMAASLIVTTLSAFVAFLLLYRLTAELFDTGTAKRAVIYLATFPTAFFLFSGYAEPVLLATALATFYFARHGHGWSATLASIGTTLARPYGFLITVPLAIQAYLERNKRLPWVAAIVGAIGALAFWLLFWQIKTGDALFWLHGTASAWQDVYVFPGQTILLTIQFIISGQGAVGNNLLDFFPTMIILAAVVAGLGKMPFAFSAYALIILILPLVIYTQGAGADVAPMIGMARRSLNAFPAFMTLASTWRGKWQELIWVVGFGSVQTIIFGVFVWWLMVD